MGKKRNRNKGRKSGASATLLVKKEQGSHFVVENNFAPMYPSGAKPKVKAYSEALERNIFSGSMESKFTSEINESVEEYEVILNRFNKEYLKWKAQRQNTISELNKLVDDVHKEQLLFNSANLIFKVINVETRKWKTPDNSPINLFASFATMVTDTIGGVTSIFQACNIDVFMKAFNRIMNNDAEITKPLYAARSSCFSKFKDVEEIVRRYHSDTFAGTMHKILNTLQVDDMRLDLKCARSDDNVTQVCRAIDGFFTQISKVEVLNDVCKSIESYVDNNPAVLEACESTGKALCGIYDTWGHDRKKDSSVLARTVSLATNRAFIQREESKIGALRNLVSDESMSQAKLESTICEASEELEKESREMEKLYYNSKFYKEEESYVEYDDDYRDYGETSYYY